MFFLSRIVPRFDNVFSSRRKGNINKDVSLLSLSPFLGLTNLPEIVFGFCAREISFIYNRNDRVAVATSVMSRDRKK